MSDEITSLERQLEEAKERKRKAESNWSAYVPGACFGRRSNTAKKFTAWKVIRIFREESIWEEYIDYENKETEVTSIDGHPHEWPRVPVTPEAFLKVGQTYTKLSYSDQVQITPEHYEILRKTVLEAIELGQRPPKPAPKERSESER